jgi:hypothetical protein
LLIISGFRINWSNLNKPVAAMGKPMGGVFLGYPPETCAEPDNDGDYDYEESARERKLMLDDLPEVARYRR